MARTNKLGETKEQKQARYAAKGLVAKSAVTDDWRRARAIEQESRVQSRNVVVNGEIMQIGANGQVTVLGHSGGCEPA